MNTVTIILAVCCFLFLIAAILFYVKTVSQKTRIEMMERQSERDLAGRDEKFNAQLKLVEEQLKSATEKLLEQREESLKKTNTEEMSHVVAPLKETIEQVRKTMSENKESHDKNTAAMEQKIEEMMKQTVTIGQKADNLSEALRGGNKFQGDWGEIKLKELLESQGLQEGVHFDTQTALRDEYGGRVNNGESKGSIIPDVVLHYPEGRGDVVIDSKVSLSAYMDYLAATNDADRKSALDRHIDSIEKHFKELSKKDYSSYLKNGHKMLNYVIMFVPDEGALQLAILNKSGLWRSAFDQHVFITGAQNLIAALNIIGMTWMQVSQARNQEKIFGVVNELLDRVGDFLVKFRDVGDKIGNAKSSYDKCVNKLYDGNQSVIKSADKLKRLGGKDNPNRPVSEPNPEIPGE